MHRPALAAALALAALSGPLAAQGVPGEGINPFNFFNDPPGTKPNGWVSQHDPYVSFSATGTGELAVGNFGEIFEQSLGVRGPGSLGIHFAIEAGYFFSVLAGRPGSEYTFRSFLNGTLVHSQSRIITRYGGAMSYDPGLAFNYLEITLREPDGASAEAIEGMAWFNAEHHGVATPEPASMALLGTGLAGLVAARRRRQRGREAAE